MVAEFVTVNSYSEGEVVIPEQTLCNSGVWIVLKGRLDGNEMVLNLFDIAGDNHIQDSTSE